MHLKHCVFVLEKCRSFSCVDKNEGGSISFDESADVFAAIGHIDDYRIMKTLFQEADKNGRSEFIVGNRILLTDKFCVVMYSFLCG